MPATFCELKTKGKNMAETAGNIVETRSCHEDSARVEKIPVCCLLIVSEKEQERQYGRLHKAMRQDIIGLGILSCPQQKEKAEMSMT